MHKHIFTIIALIALAIPTTAAAEVLYYSESSLQLTPVQKRAVELELEKAGLSGATVEVRETRPTVYVRELALPMQEVDLWLFVRKGDKVEHFNGNCLRKPKIFDFFKATTVALRRAITEMAASQ
ncbi:MAG: hypothetical protein U5L10_00985 [Candidatus Moranbacteria bacterium]|nr:hypothetical protein [Candidatus Moranbacteria bacterium]